MNAASALGIGLDIAGAGILAAGLLISPASLKLRASTFWGGFTAPLAVDGAQARADAEAGFAALAVGFGAQFVGLAASEIDVTVVEGAVIALVGATAWASTWRFVWRPTRCRSLIAEMARVKVTSQLERPERLSAPLTSELLAMGVLLGEQPVKGERVRDWALRVFRLDDVIEDHRQPDEQSARPREGE